MEDSIKYVHTNIITKDWQNLARFYIEVFECKPQYPERDLAGEWLDKLTMIERVKIKGIHLALPGYESGPTLEIFEYSPESPSNGKEKINTPGFGHIAFHVNSVERIAEKLIRHGGSLLGEIVRKEYADYGILTVVYASDPDGNFIEIQNRVKQILL
jgi:predicted enzyme related to lactoylglutathione lyase